MFPENVMQIKALQLAVAKNTQDIKETPTQKITTSSNSTAINLHDGLSIELTVTMPTTIAINNAPTTGTVVVVLSIVNGGAHVVTWPAAVKWPNGVAPTLTESGRDIITITTMNTNAYWYGSVVGSRYTA